jgi:cell division transport system permease protein
MTRGETAAAAEARLLGDGSGVRAMSWVMVVMLYLTVLAGALGLATHNVADGLDRQLGGRMTVQLLGASEANTGRVASALRAMPQVAAATPVPRAELAAVLQPWLGDAGLDPDLPMPAMIDVDLADISDTAAAAVEARVAALSPRARVDRSARWLASTRGLVVALAWLAAGLVLLTASATAAVVLLSARAGLETHRYTIDVLHMLGSTDGQISRLFQRRIALDTLAGGLLGTGLALATVWLIGARVGALDAALVGGAGLGTRDWLLLAVLPVAFALLATLAARFAIVRTLRRVL